MEKRILYISGAGRSGSTLLDIVLGSHEQSVSIGELINFTDKGMLNGEYCSCGQPVPDCYFWKTVFLRWSSRSNLTLEEFNKANRYFHSNWNILVLIKNYIYPSTRFRRYYEDVARLYDVLFKVSGRNLIIDSSKSPLRILILKKVSFDFTVLHLVRNFVGVLNSNKTSKTKDLRGGVERDRPPLKSAYIFLVWISSNFLTRVFSLGNRRIRVRYEHFIHDPLRTLSTIYPVREEQQKLLINKGPFNAEHMVAGNRLRMKKDIYLKPSDDLKTPNLSKTQYRLARVINWIFN